MNTNGCVIESTVASVRDGAGVAARHVMTLLVTLLVTLLCFYE